VNRITIANLCRVATLTSESMSAVFGGQPINSPFDDCVFRMRKKGFTDQKARDICTRLNYPRTPVKTSLAGFNFGSNFSARAVFV
jgi:hypothetical protein